MVLVCLLLSRCMGVNQAGGLYSAKISFLLTSCETHFPELVPSSLVGSWHQFKGLSGPKEASFIAPQ